MLRTISAVALVIIGGLIGAFHGDVHKAPRAQTTVSYTPLVPPVVGDGVTDDTAAMQGFISALPNFSKVILPFGTRILLTSTLHVDTKMGIEIVAEAGSGTSNNGIKQCGACLLWNFAAAGQPMLTYHQSRGCKIENVGLFVAPTSANPSVGIDYDIISGLSGPICSDNIVNRCGIYGPAADCGFKGISISATSLNNCEFIQIRDTTINVSNVTGTTGVRTGCGIFVGPSYNAKSELYENVHVGGAAYGIYHQNGSFTAINCTGSYSDTAFRIDNSGGPITIMGSGGGFEYSKCALWNAGARNPITMQGMRFASLCGAGVLKVTQSAWWILLMGNTFAPTTTGQTQVFDPGMITTGYGSSVRSIGNAWGVPNPNLATYPNFHSDVSDVFSKN